MALVCGGDEEVGGFPERVCSGERLGISDIEGGAGDFSLLKSGE